MRATEGEARARVGLLGNPSDGYGGRVIAFTFAERGARVRVEPRDGRAGIALRGERGELRARDAGELAARLREGDGGQQLLAAAALRFARRGPDAFAAAARAGLALDFDSDVPRQSGLAGSSAIVVAALRALGAALEAPLAPLELAELALRAETDELGIAAGPQDRVVQAVEGLLFMDFGGAAPRVERLDPALLPPLFLAFPLEPGASSGVAHGELRRRFEAGDPEVRAAMARFAELADGGRRALHGGDEDALRELLDASFELRASVMEVSVTDRDLVALGRGHGAAVSLPGSGGAVVGLPRSPAELGPLEEVYRAAGYGFLRPTVSTPLS